MILILVLETIINFLTVRQVKIPNDRINVDANPTQNSTNFVTSGTIYERSR